MRDLDDRELSTILAALRTYQAAGYASYALRPLDIHEIATNTNECVSLTDEEIDALCERLNCRPAVKDLED